MQRTITHIVEPSRLPLVWQDTRGRSRQRLVVGELRRDEDSIEFAYLPESQDFSKAKELGFRGYPAFRKFTQVYREGVIDAFLRRLPPRNRDDFGKYLDNLRLPKDQAMSDLTLLAYSGAKLPSDGFSLIPPFEGVEQDCELLVEVAGFRYQDGIAIDDLTIGERAEFEAEPSNPADPQAVRVMVRGHRIGYVNRVQTQAFLFWLKNMKVRAWVERKNGRPERPLVYLFVEVRKAPAPSDALEG